MHRLLVFWGVLAAIYSNSEAMNVVVCKRLISGIFCLPGPEGDPETMKPLLDGRNWELLKSKMKAGKKMRGLEEHKEDQEVEKRGFKDGRIRILRLPEHNDSN